MRAPGGQRTARCPECGFELERDEDECPNCGEEDEEFE